MARLRKKGPFGSKKEACFPCASLFSDQNRIGEAKRKHASSVLLLCFYLRLAASPVVDPPKVINAREQDMDNNCFNNV